MTTFDQQFIDMMVPHHLSAVEMAKIAADRGEHPEIEALAAEIISAQETEIAQMRSRSDSPRQRDAVGWPLPHAIRSRRAGAQAVWSWHHA